MTSSWKGSPEIALGRKRTYTVFGRRSGPDESSFHGIVVSGRNVFAPSKPPSLDTRIDDVVSGKLAVILTSGSFVYWAPLLIDTPSGLAPEGSAFTTRSPAAVEVSPALSVIRTVMWKVPGFA